MQSRPYQEEEGPHLLDCHQGEARERKLIEDGLHLSPQSLGLLRVGSVTRSGVTSYGFAYKPLHVWYGITYGFAYKPLHNTVRYYL